MHDEDNKKNEELDPNDGDWMGNWMGFGGLRRNMRIWRFRIDNNTPKLRGEREKQDGGGFESRDVKMEHLGGFWGF